MILTRLHARRTTGRRDVVAFPGGQGTVRIPQRGSRSVRWCRLGGRRGRELLVIPTI